jgi:hypothetical protein
MESDHFFLVEGIQRCEDISNLSSYHAHITYSFRDFSDHLDMPRLSETLDTHDLESISSEESSNFTIFLPGSRLLSSGLMIIYHGEI